MRVKIRLPARSGSRFLPLGFRAMACHCDAADRCACMRACSRVGLLDLEPGWAPACARIVGKNGRTRMSDFYWSTKAKRDDCTSTTRRSLVNPSTFMPACLPKCLASARPYVRGLVQQIPDGFSMHTARGPS